MKEVDALTPVCDAPSRRERGSEFLVLIQLIEYGCSYGL
jgi:hypothetical protein